MGMKHFARLFIIFILLNSQTAFAFAESNSFDASKATSPEATSESALQEGQPASYNQYASDYGGDNVQAAPVSFSCSTSSLSPQDTQQIMNLLKDGFVGKELSSGDTNKDVSENREALDNSTIILTDPDDNSNAAKVDLPNQKFKPYEMSHLLNTYLSGPFAFGVILDDSLRAGRCKEYDTSCWLTGTNLTKRNSGEGIIENTKNIFSQLKESLTSDDNNKQFSEKDKEVLEAMAQLNDLNSSDATIKTLKRLDSKLIPNSILTGVFTATISTNCTNNGCTISTYSMFDKYFNAWMSAEMVFSTFGPELLYRSGKLLGWLNRRNILVNPIKSKLTDLADRFRMKFSSLDSTLGNMRMARAARRLQKYPGMRKFYMSLGDEAASGGPGTGGPIVQTVLFDQWWAKQIAKGGYLDELNTPELRSEFVKFIKDLRSVIRAHWKPVDLAKQEYAQVMAKYGPGHPATKQAYLNFGREYMKFLNSIDDMGELHTLVDAQYWMKSHPTVKLYNKGYMDSATGEVVPFLDEHRAIRVITDKFANTGTLKFTPEDVAKYGASYATDDAGNLLLYTIDDQSIQNVRGLSWANVKTIAQNPSATLIRDTFIPTDAGEFIKLSPSSGEFIQNRISGHPQLVTGKWKVFRAETPEDFIARLTNPRIYNNIRNIQGNIETMYNTLRERNFTSRRFWNYLDKLFAQEDTLVKTYFSLKGGARLTAYQYAYWYSKRAGIPGFEGTQIEGLSAYMLPDTWKEITIYQREADLYSNAYIDFFANEGSDDGDMFARVINNLPWAMVYEKVATLWQPADEAVQKLSKSQHRTKVENLAFYITQPNECLSCGITMKSPELDKFSPFFISNNTLDSYILEDTQSEEAKKKGQLLIAYSSHSDLKGESGDGTEGEPIELLKAKEEKKTCKDAVEQSNWGLSWLPGMEGKNIGPAVAGVIGGAEMLSYYFFFWGGIFSTVWSQVEVIPQFRDCVDADEGYFIHYFAPAIEENSSKDVPELSTESAANFLDYLKDSFLETVRGDENSLTEEAAKKIGDEIDNFVKDAKKNNIVQARLTIVGTSSGQLEGIDLLYFWCGEGCKADAAYYRTEGKTVISDPEKGITVAADYEKGQLLRNGAPIISNPDAVRMMSTDSRIPATEIPQNLTVSCMPDSNETAIVINSRGEAFVENQSLLACISDGVMQQTGLPFDSGNKNLVDVFGKVSAVVTSTHPNVKPLDGKIIAEGNPRKVAQGEGSLITISAGGAVNLANSNDGIPSLGKLVSIQFKNGVIVVKPDGCLLIWLKHHENGILSQNDVKGINTNLTHVTNPETGCEEPAVNFEVQGNPESDYSMKKAELFNQSLAHMGPFQSFETPDKRYILYMDEDCVEHLRIIDKATGEITDLKGTTTQTPTGIKFTDENGKEHTLDFSTKDGVPVLTYNNGKPEALIAAQGKNGSFWYDPKEGLWYAENGQLIPLLDAFRQGISTQVGPNGAVTSTASGNVLNLELGNDKSNLLNLPSLPENAAALFLFIAAAACSFILVRRARVAVR